MVNELISTANMDVLTTSLLLGAFIGILLSLTGAGGGILSVPLLVFALHISVGEASPVSLLAIMLAACVGAYLGLHDGTVRYKAAGLMAVCGVAFAPLGIWAAQRLPNSWLILIFIFVLVYVAVKMLRQENYERGTANSLLNRLAQPCQTDNMRGRLMWTAPCAYSIMAVGSSAGFLTGLLGIGGGFIIVPALRRYTNLDIKSIVATSLAVITIVSSGGLIMASSRGLVNWDLAWPFASGAVLGMLSGRKIARRLAEPLIQQVFAILALLIATGLLLKLIVSDGFFF